MVEFVYLPSGTICVARFLVSVVLVGCSMMNYWEFSLVQGSVGLMLYVSDVGEIQAAAASGPSVCFVFARSFDQCYMMRQCLRRL